MASVAVNGNPSAPTSDRQHSPLLLLFGLSVLLLIINPAVTLSFDDVYLWPKVWWIYGVIVPSAGLLLWQERHSLRNSCPLLLLSTWAAWLVLSTLLNGVGWSGWRGATDRADGVLMHLAYAAVLLAGFAWMNSETASRRLLTQTVLICGSLLALTNVLQQVGWMGVPGEGAFSGVMATPYGGTLGNRGYLGGALALLLPLAVASISRSRSWLWAWGATVVISWAWAGSFTRGAWLAGGVGLIWLAFCARKQVPWRAWGAVALGIALCVVTAEVRGAGRGFSIPGAPSGTTATAQPLADSSGRKVLWNSALFGIAERPLLGWGTPALWRAMNERPARELLAEFGTTDIVTMQRLNTRKDQAPDFMVTGKDGFRHRVTLTINKVHNEYLDYALTYGLPTALMLIALLGWAIWSGRSWTPGVSAGLVAYAVYLVTWPEVIRFAPIAWFMMGIALAGHRSRRSKFQA